MLNLDFDISDIFKINSFDEFNEISLKIFRFQAEHNPVYREFLSHIKVNTEDVSNVDEIPFLPIDFFKTHKVLCDEFFSEKTFKSSGTTQSIRSQHHIADLNIYETSFIKGFEHFYGNPKDFCFLALLPNYMEQGDSSLVYMMSKLIELSKDNDSAFYLDNLEDLNRILQQKEAEQKPTILIGVTYALLDFAESFPQNLNNTIVMETGGMKGRKKEMIRTEVHELLKKRFGLNKIHSEYGMTELLSQAYSKGNGIFETPPWMQIRLRSINDPFSPTNKASGAINVIDLANIYSCSFIATQDIGKKLSENTFEVLGRTDNSDLRGCNLMVI